MYVEYLEFHVAQATAAYSLKAEHPLFFYWTEDGTAAMDSFRDNGYKCLPPKMNTAGLMA